jgi:hypothetical protein
MYISIWIIHIIVTLIYVGLLIWCLSIGSDSGQGYISGLGCIFTVPIITFLYMTYWIVFLVIKVVTKG